MSVRPAERATTRDAAGARDRPCRGEAPRDPDRSRRVALVTRRALLMIVAAIEAEFGLGDEKAERKAG